MLPLVCSASPGCSSPFPISFPAGSRKIALSWRFEQKCVLDHKGFIKPNASGNSHPLVLEAPDSCPHSIDPSIFSSYPSYFDDIGHNSLAENQNLYSKAIDFAYDTEIDQGSAINSETVLDAPLSGDAGVDFTYSIEASQGSAVNSESVLDASQSGGVQLNIEGYLSQDGVSIVKENVGDLISRIRDSSSASVSSAQKTVEETYGDLVKKGTDSIDSVIGRFTTSFQTSKDQAGDKLSAVSSDLKDNLSDAGGVVLDVLRKAVVSFEGLLPNATAFVVSSYESAKSFLPSEVLDSVNAAEEKSSLILAPISFVFGKAYFAVEELERSLGIDPNDPLVHLVLFVAGSTALWIFYWRRIYGGYSGDLSPEFTFELLNREDNVVLIDIRPEDLRERDGIPDLRRRARFKYANVEILEVDGPLMKSLRSEEEAKEALTASIIRNLKIVNDGTNIIVLDASGEKSKRIARSLGKLGVKRAFLVKGGYLSWVRSGLRVKELKPETALDVISEEAEAILEEIKPTPVSIVGYTLGAAVSFYALLEWEKTLQLIGVIGLGQSLYRRVSSYESSADLKADLGRLLTPVTWGAQALSRATGRGESKLGLATSPSSTAVQDRVVQAAAKHESQPSDPVEPSPAAET